VYKTPDRKKLRMTMVKKSLPIMTRMSSGDLDEFRGPMIFISVYGDVTSRRGGAVVLNQIELSSHAASNATATATADDAGFITYTNHFGDVIELVEVKRAILNDGTAVYLGFLDRLRDGTCTDEDWTRVVKTCSQDSMSPQEWDECFGPGQDVTYLFTTNREVRQYNLAELKKLESPIVLIHAKVMLTSNVCPQAGLCNGATGFVKEFIYEEEEHVSALELPTCIWVDFGEDYRGPTYFPDCPERRGWLPIHPITASTCNNGIDLDSE
jgi:hypothetical protein